MKSFLLQDWLQIASANLGPVVQSTDAWLDLSAYRDVVAWIDVKRANSAQVTYQTAPAKDDLLFATMSTLTPSVGVTVTPMLQEVQAVTSGVVPLARWFRWSLSSGVGAFDITFRIWLAANKPGRR